MNGLEFALEEHDRPRGDEPYWREEPWLAGSSPDASPPAALQGAAAGFPQDGSHAVRADDTTGEMSSHEAPKSASESNEETTMPLNVRNTGAKEFRKVPQGIHIAVCNMVVD